MQRSRPPKTGPCQGCRLSLGSNDSGQSRRGLAQQRLQGVEVMMNIQGDVAKGRGKEASPFEGFHTSQKHGEWRNALGHVEIVVDCSLENLAYLHWFYIDFHQKTSLSTSK